ncbi:MAG: LysM peptidoglycan-binding domain-containing protein [Methylophaga sp.]|nr:LysM peptidoglycan-binding domain-containing protein [Methylophaga sp.]
MLNLKKLIWPALIALTVVTSGCSTTSKHVEIATTGEADLILKKRPVNWQRNHLVELSSRELDLRLFEQPEAIDIDDLWQRIRNGYGMSDYRVLRPETQTRLSWFVNRPDYVNSVVERARPYLFYIVDELDKRNMPLEIALLPVIESGFQPFANSPSGAAGIWQFIPGTGKVFGLEQTWWYDARRDVMRSTDAALDYLQKLHGDFGDWQLALAAYNAGEGTVGRAIKKNIAEGRDTDFWSLELPTETTAYIPKLLAVAHLVKQPAQYDIQLSPITNKPYLTRVNIGSQLDLALAADLAEMSKDDLHKLNPGFNRWATVPTGPHQLVLPIAKAENFQTALAQLPREQRLSWQRHKVQSGESLGQIANRHQTTVTAIKQANKLSSNLIRAGAHLMIPVASANAGESESVAVNNSQSKRTGYIVKAGDSWWHIAKKHAVDVSDLAAWNKKSLDDVLHSGQQLVVWLPDTSKINRKTVNYIIQSGDSLWKISRKFNVKVADVKAWNNLGERSLLRPGQQLTLYVEKS